MKLNFPERMIILSVLPKEGNYVTIRLIREIISKLAASAQEIKDFGIIEKEDGAVGWNAKGGEHIEIEMNPLEVDLVRKQLKDLDSKDKLAPEMITVYEKFCM